MGERELVLVVSVRCGRHDTWTTITKMCNPELCSLSLACSRDEMPSCCATLYVLYLWVYCSQRMSSWCARSCKVVFVRGK